MILKECLEDLKNEEIVAIGPKQGTAFCYIGKAKNTELIEEAFADRLMTVSSQYDTASRELRRMLTEPVELTGNKKADDAILYKQGHDVASCYKKISIAQETMNKPVLERKVAETYRRDTDGAMVILVRGIEAGTFWLKEEFDRVYK